MSTGVREPVAAGALYASDSQELRSDIDAAINSADTEFTSPKVLVVPDCGLAATPAVTGRAMVMLESERDHVERVVVLGDYEPGLGERQFAGVAVPRAIAFRTPLGDLLLDRAGAEALQTHPGVVVNDRPFLNNTSIEVHLPPVQRLLGAVRILPMLVGEASTREIVDVIERVWGGRDTLIILSSSFGTGTDRDEVAAAGEAARTALSGNDVAAIGDAPVSSPRTLAAMLTIVARRSMGLLELAAETMTDPADGSAYLEAAAFAAWESNDLSLAEADAQHLRAMARSAVELTVLGGRVAGSDIGRVPPALTARRASVVTLRREGQTRGSAGTIEADRPLAGSVVRNAAAACADPRLPSIQPAELNGLNMTITIVSPIERIFPATIDGLYDLLEPRRHGVLVTSPAGRAAQLPAMWARFDSHEDFVAAVLAKASIEGAGHLTDAAWYRFETVDY